MHIPGEELGNDNEDTLSDIVSMLEEKTATIVFESAVTVLVLVTTAVLSAIRSNGSVISLIIAASYTLYNVAYHLLASFVHRFRNPPLEGFLLLWSWWLTFSFLFGATDTVIPEDRADTASLAISIAALAVSLLSTMLAQSYIVYAYALCWAMLVVASFLPTPDRILFFENMFVSIVRVAMLAVTYLYLRYATDACIDVSPDIATQYFISQFWLIIVNGRFLFAYPVVFFLARYVLWKGIETTQPQPPPPPPPPVSPLPRQDNFYAPSHANMPIAEPMPRVTVQNNIEAQQRKRPLPPPQHTIPRPITGPSHHLHTELSPEELQFIQQRRAQNKQRLLIRGVL